MSSTRVMNGLEDITGRTFGTLRAVRMVRRSPEPLYATNCEQCGAESTATHSRLRNGAAVCKSSGHSKVSTARSTTTERSKLSELESERIAAERAASEARMDSETEGYERAERYAPTPTKHVVMSERERIAIREFNEAEEAERIEAERPAREAEQRAAAEQAEREKAEQERKDKQTAYWREWVLNDRDPQLYISPELVSVEMPTAKAQTYNLDAVQQFVATTQEYGEYRTPENAGKITDYLSRNGVNIFDVPTLKAAFVRLRDLGIVTKRIAPTPEPTPAPSRVNLRISDEPKPAPVDDGSETGIDWKTGHPLTLTKRQVAQLGAEDYRRFRKLDGQALSLKPLSPLYRGDDA